MGYLDKKRQAEYQRCWMAKRRATWISILGNCCYKCGSTNRIELDHVDRKTKVSNSIWSWKAERIVQELSKCQLLCHDCHKIKTLSEITLPLVHGIFRGYDKGCRCSECRRANTEAVQRRRRRKKLSINLLGVC